MAGKRKSQPEPAPAAAAPTAGAEAAAAPAPTSGPNKMYTQVQPAPLRQTPELKLWKQLV